MILARLTWELFGLLALAAKQGSDNQQGGPAAYGDICDIESGVRPDDDAAVVAPVKEQEIDNVT